MYHVELVRIFYHYGQAFMKKKDRKRILAIRYQITEFNNIRLSGKCRFCVIDFNLRTQFHTTLHNDHSAQVNGGSNQTAVLLNYIIPNLNDD